MFCMSVSSHTQRLFVGHSQGVSRGFYSLVIGMLLYTWGAHSYATASISTAITMVGLGHNSAKHAPDL